MSHISFENNIIEASGNLILKSNKNTIDCCGTDIRDVSSIQINNNMSCSSLLVDTISSNSDTIIIEASGNLILKSNKNTIDCCGTDIRDVSSIQINNNMSCSSLLVDTISSNSDTIIIDKKVTIKLDETQNILELNQSTLKLNVPISTNGLSSSGIITFNGPTVDTNTGFGKIGFVNDDNTALHIVNSKEHIHLKRYETDNSYSYINIGILDGSNYKHESNSLIEAPSFYATSDYRTKTNIEELDENTTVSNLRPLMYLKNGKKEIGLIAHELQEEFPFMVCGKKDGEQMQSVNYNSLIGVLINDIKRLTNENEILKLNNDALKSDCDTLKTRIDAIETRFNKKFE